MPLCFHPTYAPHIVNADVLSVWLIIPPLALVSTKCRHNGPDAQLDIRCLSVLTRILTDSPSAPPIQYCGTTTAVETNPEYR